MNEILSFVQPARSNKIFACGWRYIDKVKHPDARLASVFKMDDQGDVQYVYVFGNRAWESESQDICKAIDYDPDNREIVMLLEVTTPELRPDYYLYSRYSAANKDILIVTMNDDGRLQEAYNINMGKAGISLYIGGHSMFIKDGHYIFGGYSWGYKTRYQNSTFDVTAPDFDTYVFKYNPTEREDCLYQVTISSSGLRQETVTDPYTIIDDPKSTEYKIRAAAALKKKILRIQGNDVAFDIERDRYLFR